MVTFIKKERYEVGDKVQVIGHISDVYDTYRVAISDEMHGYVGDILTISGIGEEEDDDITYRVEENEWYWSNDLFLGIIKQIKLSKKARTKKIGQIIKEIKKNKEYSKCFKDIDKEVNEWNDYQIAKWKEN